MAFQGRPGSLPVLDPEVLCTVFVCSWVYRSVRTFCARRQYPTIVVLSRELGMPHMRLNLCGSRSTRGGASPLASGSIHQRSAGPYGGPGCCSSGSTRYSSVGWSEYCRTITVTVLVPMTIGSRPGAALLVMVIFRSSQDGSFSTRFGT